MESQKVIDVGSIVRRKTGSSYAHEYDGYIAFFQSLACEPLPVRCENAPSCWVPLIKHMGHHVGAIDKTTGDGWDANGLEWSMAYEQADDKRRIVEVASTTRPELVHALYCYDTEWNFQVKSVLPGGESNVIEVTCNASFFRPEFNAYRTMALPGHSPKSKKAVICPCAASKPYPAPLHSQIQDRMPEGWELIVATGVLGLIPEDLFIKMPLYDSGLPNIERCTQTVQWYFSKHKYDAVVVYSDFYAYAVANGFARIAPGLRPRELRFIFGDHYRDRYENLTLPEHLAKLEVAIREVDSCTTSARSH